MASLSKVTSSKLGLPQRRNFPCSDMGWLSCVVWGVYLGQGTFQCLIYLSVQTESSVPVATKLSSRPFAVPLAVDSAVM